MKIILTILLTFSILAAQDTLYIKSFDVGAGVVDNGPIPAGQSLTYHEPVVITLDTILQSYQAYKIERWIDTTLGDVSNQAGIIAWNFTMTGTYDSLVNDTMYFGPYWANVFLVGIEMIETWHKPCTCAKVQNIPIAPITPNSTFTEVHERFIYSHESFIINWCGLDLPTINGLIQSKQYGGQCGDFAMLAQDLQPYTVYLPPDTGDVFNLDIQGQDTFFVSPLFGWLAKWNDGTPVEFGAVRDTLKYCYNTGADIDTMVAFDYVANNGLYLDVKPNCYKNPSTTTTANLIECEVLPWGYLFNYAHPSWLGYWSGRTPSEFPNLINYNSQYGTTLTHTNGYSNATGEPSQALFYLSTQLTPSCRIDGLINQPVAMADLPGPLVINTSPPSEPLHQFAIYSHAGKLILSGKTTNLSKEIRKLQKGLYIVHYGRERYILSNG